MRRVTRGVSDKKARSKRKKLRRMGEIRKARRNQDDTEQGTSIGGAEGVESRKARAGGREL